MRRIENVVRVMAGVIALLVMAPPSAPAQEKNQATLVKKQAAAPAQGLKRIAAVADKKPHRLILQVNSNEPAMMNLALNNATNVVQYYKDRGESVAIDIVTFGPGLHMLRDDTSPVKARIKTISESNPSISFQACANTRDNMSRAESKEIPLMSEAKIVKSGVVRVMELQEQGWAYVKP
ncbi:MULTISPECIES: DsrE family protein [unclassified Bradyrhizobium]|uniref:DsrE family protein n=1 Tax=unclassified Bradyrhizobium TaxID=2631580 RepID=UPI002FF37AE0